MRKSARLGFSLVETIVALVILAILTAFVLPTIQKVREDHASTRRSISSQQFATSVRNEHVNDRFDPGMSPAISGHAFDPDDGNPFDSDQTDV